eukprot:gb/GEZN01015450.1/.p1 GENE.gb/GEZN01015450.1/~~gb/GEZN01015450.1/.p1  ORF type:complete len:252 (-),score=9.48 gb/GEZN01015450.1/:104-859(-)
MTYENLLTIWDLGTQLFLPATLYVSIIINFLRPENDEEIHRPPNTPSDALALPNFYLHLYVGIQNAARRSRYRTQSLFFKPDVWDDNVPDPATYFQAILGRNAITNAKTLDYPVPAIPRMPKRKTIDIMSLGSSKLKMMKESHSQPSARTSFASQIVILHVSWKELVVGLVLCFTVDLETLSRLTVKELITALRASKKALLVARCVVARVANDRRWRPRGYCSDTSDRTRSDQAARVTAEAAREWVCVSGV